MRRLLLATLLISASTVFAEYSLASATFPFGRERGGVWSGIVSRTNDETREITLAYPESDEHWGETFTGILVKAYKVKMKDGRQHLLKPSDLPIGTRVLVFYKNKTKKVDSKKVEYFEIFIIKFYRPEDEP